MNDSNSTIALEWMNFIGKSKRIARVPPGRRHIQKSYYKHVWRIIDLSTNLTYYFTIPSQDSYAIFNPSEFDYVKIPGLARASCAKQGGTCSCHGVVYYGTWKTIVYNVQQNYLKKFAT